MWVGWYRKSGVVGGMCCVSVRVWLEGVAKRVSWKHRRVVYGCVTEEVEEECGYLRHGQGRVMETVGMSQASSR